MLGKNQGAPIKLFVICLDKTFEQRCKPTLDELKSCNANIELIPFDAVKGKDVEHNLLHPFAMRTALTGNRDIDDQLSHVNQAGCSLSHIKLWEKTVELDEPVIIAEDDLFDGKTCGLLNFFNLIEDHMGFVSMQNLVNKSSPYSGTFRKLHSFIGTGLYYITPDTAKKIT